MKYKMIKVAMSHMGKPVWRKFYINEDTSLFEMGILILSSFNSQFEHMFMYTSKSKVQYVDYRWLDDVPPFSKIKRYDYERFTLKGVFKDLENITLVYDTGEYYEFKFTTYDESKDALFADSLDNVILISGKGFGIIENCIDAANAITSGINFEEHVNDCYGISYEEFCDNMLLIDPEDYFEKLDVNDLQEKMRIDFLELSKIH